MRLQHVERRGAISGFDIIEASRRELGQIRVREVVDISDQTRQRDRIARDKTALAIGDAISDRHSINPVERDGIGRVDLIDSRLGEAAQEDAKI